VTNLAFFLRSGSILRRRLSGLVLAAIRFTFTGCHMLHMSEHVEVRTDHRITTAGSGAVTPEDAHRLHAWPDDPPDSDEPVRWAIMDTGVHEDLFDDHPWFEDATLGRQYDATGAGVGDDRVGHGSGCASLVARNTPAVELWSVRIFGESGRTDQSAIRDAYRWLIDHADELHGVNMSWGARSDDPEIDALHEKLVSKGVYDVVAAGNTGGEGGSPATSHRAFSVGAVTEEGDLTRFTSRDPKQDNPDIAAVGKDVKMAQAPETSMGTPLSEGFLKASGTSFAAPYASAAYVNALYRARQSWDAVFERVAPDIPGTKADGEGLLKLDPALGEVEPDEPTPSADATVVQFDGRDTVFIAADWLSDGDAVVEKLDETKDAVDVRVRQ
jgi:hypothetical protein